MTVRCAVCGRTVRVTRAGTLIRHRDTNKHWCANGGGEQPVSDSADVECVCANIGAYDGLDFGPCPCECANCLANCQWGGRDWFRVSTRLMLTTPCDERDGHAFHLRVEEQAPGVAMVGGVEVPMPWLRAACSCGWVADDERRFTIEENAHWLWLGHLNEAGAGGNDAR